MTLGACGKIHGPAGKGEKKLLIRSLQFKIAYLDFPGGALVKNPPANAGDTGSSPGLGRSHMPWSS